MCTAILGMHGLTQGNHCLRQGHMPVSASSGEISLVFRVTYTDDRKDSSVVYLAIVRPSTVANTATTIASRTKLRPVLAGTACTVSPSNAAGHAFQILAVRPWAWSGPGAGPLKGANMALAAQ